MFKLRPYQEKLKSEIYSAWESGHKNILGVMPTGLGKSVVLSSIAYDYGITKKIPVAIMVHRKELVSQLCVTLASASIKHNIIAPKSTILDIVNTQRFTLNKSLYEYTAPITVLSVDTLNARFHKHEAWSKNIGLWIVDEAAHLLKANKWGRAVQPFESSKGLGVTATPRRLDCKGLGRHVDGVFDAMVEGPTVLWGIENGYLSKYKIAIPKSDYQNYLNKASGNSDYTRESMRKASKQSQIIGDVVENYVKFAEGKQAILFATDIETAQDMERKFKLANIPAKLLTGLSSNKERFEGIINFKNKNIKVLLNVDLFDEGLDVPGIECVIMARPTMSLSKYKQMVGRGLRPAPNKEFLILIDHVGNVDHHGLPCANKKWTLDRITKKKTIKTEELIKICKNPMCNAPFQRILTKCPYCGEDVEKIPKDNTGRVPPEMVDGDLELIDPQTMRELESFTNLESPDSVSKRVERVAGLPAGIKARRDQEARIEAQKILSEGIAIWAGNMKTKGFDDRSIHKFFYLHFGMTIFEALSQPRMDMAETLHEIKRLD